MKKRISRMAVFALLILPVAAMAEPDAAFKEEQAAPTSSRMANRIGGYLGILGDPSPTILGVNAAYNVTDFLRAHAGWGNVSASGPSGDVSVNTLGLGVNGMWPGQDLTPVVGLSYSHLFTSGTISEFELNNVYATFGGDWQSESGFNIGLGLNVSLNDSITLPYLNFGWFF